MHLMAEEEQAMVMRRYYHNRYPPSFCFADSGCTAFSLQYQKQRDGVLLELPSFGRDLNCQQVMEPLREVSSGCKSALRRREEQQGQDLPNRSCIRVSPEWYL